MGLESKTTGCLTEGVVRLGVGALLAGIGLLPFLGVPAAAFYWAPFTICWVLAGIWVALLGRIFRGMRENWVTTWLLVLGVGGWFLTSTLGGLAYPALAFATLCIFAMSRHPASAALRSTANLGQLGLRPAGWVSPPAAHGKTQGLDVLVEEHDLGMTATVSSPQIPASLSLGPAWVFGRVRTGDAAFDDVVRVNGPPELVLARFHPRARAAAQNALAEGVVLEEGIVRWFARAPGSRPPLAAMIELGAALAEPRTLAEAALGDPSVGVRLAAVERTAQAEESVRRPTLARALEDESNKVRLTAAKLVIEDEGSPDRARAEALLREVEEAHGGLALSEGGELSIASTAGAVSLVKKTPA